MSKEEFKALRLTQQHPFVGRFVFITLTIIAIFIAFLFLPWQQTVKASGELIAYDPTKRPYELLAPIDGFVKRYAAREGQEVKAGELLFELQDLDPKRLEHLKEQKRGIQAQIEELRQGLQTVQKRIELQQKVMEQERTIAKEREANLLEQAAALKKRRAALQEQLFFVERNYKRYERLAKSGAVSQKLFEQWRTKFLSARASLQEIVAKIAMNKNERKILQKRTVQRLNGFQATIESLQMKQKELNASIERLTSQLAKMASEIGRYYHRVYAKEDGVVVRILKNDANRYIKKGEPLLEFAPKTDKWVLRVKVSDFNMPLIRDGLKARIIFYGWPAMQVAGWPKISKGTYGGVVVMSEPLGRQDGSYYFLVAPDPAEDPWPDPKRLKVGTKATVWVLLDVVSIWYELWRVMMALPPNMVARSGG